MHAYLYPSSPAVLYGEKFLLHPTTSETSCSHIQPHTHNVFDIINLIVILFPRPFKWLYLTDLTLLQEGSYFMIIFFVPSTPSRPRCVCRHGRRRAFSFQGARADTTVSSIAAREKRIYIYNCICMHF